MIVGGVRMSVIIAPSLLSADFANLAEELKEIEEAGVPWIHLDVMDGLFVPNITFGPPVIKAMRKHSSLFFDCHLMIAEPSRYLKNFAEAGADLITIHEEATRDISKTLENIKALGCQAGLSINPNTPLSAIAPYVNQADLILLMSVYPGFGGQSFIDISYKIKACSELIKQADSTAKIQVDGGINKRTAKLVVDAGAEVLVAGSAIFGKPDRSKAVGEILNSL